MICKLIEKYKVRAYGESDFKIKTELDWTF
jgi:hypothetical protein